MVAYMAGINNVIDTILFYLLAAALVTVVGICFIQVSARYIFSAPFSWAEEISVLILLWATWGAACLAVKQGIHLRMRILEDRFKERTSLIVRLTLNCLAIVFLAVIVWTSRIILDAMANMTMMAVPSLPMNIMYKSVPAGCILMIYYILRTMAEDLKGFRALAREER
jgi:TRAP-type C4-dicarboxylate transport system permease small subunit